MIVGFYNPYYRTLGGGEYYLFQMMKQFLPTNQVEYYSDDPTILDKAQQQFAIDLTGVTVKPPITSFIQTRNVDRLFWYSDGSLPFSLAKKIYLIFQFPTPWVNLNLLQKLKLSRIDNIIVNSRFTKQYIDKTFHKDSYVLYPSVDTTVLQPTKKENIIVSVGRFTQGMNTKRQDILIQAFKQFVDQGNNNWRLIIAGGVDRDDESFFSSLEQQCQNYPIVLKKNISRKELIELYSKASFYWHASGFGIDVTKHPQLVEHFGIAIVEAMASGCIPCVFHAGGPAEIVNQSSGILWNSIDELIENMSRLIQSNNVKELSVKAIQRANDFNTQAFTESFRRLLG